MNKRINLMNMPVDNLSMGETLDMIKDVVENNGHMYHSVVNAGKAVLMHKDPELYNSVANADIINADGAGIVMASRIMGTPVKERVTGIDLMVSLLKMAAMFRYKVFLLGGTEEVVTTLTNKCEEAYGSDIITGYSHGYIDPSQDAHIANAIVRSKAQILFVAMPSPRKEKFLYNNRNVLKNVNFIMGVGGSFDVLAGKVKRAPLWMQTAGMEWLWRVAQEPGRMVWRYAKGNTQFLYLMLQYRLGIRKPIITN
jgi:N-acetylglucosaminyldiphosphoundecaprenol N-acetyl-beta-D-mannosaminyltransferase